MVLAGLALVASRTLRQNRPNDHQPEPQPRLSLWQDYNFSALRVS